MNIKGCVKNVIAHNCSNEFYIWANFSYALGYFLNLKSPKTFNEKLNWLKIHDHNPYYTRMADKYLVKNIVADIIGVEHVVPLLGVWNSPSEIDFSALPDQFVLKWNHDCSSVIVCKDKSRMNEQEYRTILERGQYVDYYSGLREWPYKNIERKIIAETFLDDGRVGELQDYKWWCFNGVPKIMYFTNKGKYGRCYENFYDMDFKPIFINHGFPRRTPEYDKPSFFDEMKSLVEKLCRDLIFVRVDMYAVNDKIYFGEYTFYDWGGGHRFYPHKTDREIGNLLKLPIEV